MNRFHALDAAVTMIDELRPLVEALGRKDKDLQDQVRRAASSVVSNLGEGNERVGRDRLHAWRIAKGSARELRLQLRIAVGWGYLDEAEVRRVDEVADRVSAMLHRLTS
jgi:four helix bundle protein